jgi:hypothetical protein
MALDQDNQAMVITGTGDSFMVEIDGPSLGEIFKPAAWEKARAKGAKVLQRLLDLPMPVVGVANGPAIIHSEYLLLSDVREARRLRASSPRSQPFTSLCRSRHWTSTCADVLSRTSRLAWRSRAWRQPISRIRARAESRLEGGREQVAGREAAVGPPLLGDVEHFLLGWDMVEVVRVPDRFAEREIAGQDDIFDWIA